MTVRVSVPERLFAWARERSGVAAENLLAKFPDLDAWEQGSKLPTLKQLERFATATHTPLGYLFLAEPPQESLPLPDFRTIRDIEVGHASPDLLETVYICQQRQEWYRDFARLHQEPSVPFVGTLTTANEVVGAASTMRSTLSFEPAERGTSWGEAFRLLIEAAERQGVLVMVNGVVGSNTHRKLDPAEFRGFALADNLAPLIFVNGADTTAAKIFTLAHELAHVWLGQSAVSDADGAASLGNEAERWCNEVAAEFLMPGESLRDLVVDPQALTPDLDRLAREFKVSTLVVLRRIFDVGYLTPPQFRAAYAAERERVLSLMEERVSTGGSFYNTQPIRVSKRFARALLESTLEGQTLYREAFRMLGFKKQATFDELVHRPGVG
ncbi:MAG TPA: ImmA/IrrE family metallo-endopeptidase [Candidatus Nanopelagicaceae bacterium]|nr:ImmA/IrrE family metallo-endopeptidase [Candidatus Nanopelagicaceae bacterium]